MPAPIDSGRAMEAAIAARMAAAEVGAGGSGSGNGVVNLLAGKDSREREQQNLQQSEKETADFLAAMALAPS